MGKKPKIRGGRNSIPPVFLQKMVYGIFPFTVVNNMFMTRSPYIISKSYVRPYKVSNHCNSCTLKICKCWNTIKILKIQFSHVRQRCISVFKRILQLSQEKGKYFSFLLAYRLHLVHRWWAHIGELGNFLGGMQECLLKWWPAKEECHALCPWSGAPCLPVPLKCLKT